MPSTDSSLQRNRSGSIVALIASAEQQLFTASPPEHSSVLKSVISERFSTRSESQTQQKNLKSSLSLDELASISKKLHELSQLPGLVFDAETELYLEQQLADMLGHEVSTHSEGIKLPFVKGIIDSLPHLLVSPSQKINQIGQVPEAGLRNTRSIFGWQFSGISDSSNKFPDFWVSLPLRSLVTTEYTYETVKNWAYKKKMLIINPADSLYCIATIQDEYLDPSNRHQFGGSPALIRQGLFWSYHNLGRAFIFFISDPNNTLKSGVYQLFS